MFKYVRRLLYATGKNIKGLFAYLFCGKNSKQKKEN